MKILDPQRSTTIGQDPDQHSWDSIPKLHLHTISGASKHILFKFYRTQNGYTFLYKVDERTVF